MYPITIWLKDHEDHEGARPAQGAAQGPNAAFSLHLCGPQNVSAKPYFWLLIFQKLICYFFVCVFVFMFFSVNLLKG